MEVVLTLLSPIGFSRVSHLQICQKKTMKKNQAEHEKLKEDQSYTLNLDDKRTKIIQNKNCCT